MASYDSIKAALDDATASGVHESRVEVNQRALIDKILARYASAGAVYRELLQNSNDAEASEAAVNFTTAADGITVTHVEYKNNGMPFRPQDWSRLQKIAEGNPDESKVGAFGVGAYSMFSICEEPMVVSGHQALAFVWKGDALWCKVMKQPRKDTTWTSFLLPSRDPYPLPDLVEYGQFLCSALTFTKCLMRIRVSVNGKERLSIVKETIQQPKIVEPPKSTSWWKNDGAVTSVGCFALQDKTIYSSKQRITVKLDGQTAQITAAYIHGTAKTKIPPDMVKRMERVTKKKPPGTVSVQLLLGAEDDTTSSNRASQITSSFLPQMGQGSIFIGFRTSQTTGLGCHLAAPLVPTVEREAIDLQDPTLRRFNTELLQFAGILMRLTLEHGMVQIGQDYQATKAKRDMLEQKLVQEAKKKKTAPATPKKEPAEEKKEETVGSSMLSFAKFMAKGVTKQITNVLSAVTEDDSLLRPLDPLPLQPEERAAILLMRSFCPRPSTPDSGVGTALAQGFTTCLPNNVPPPVLTKKGVVRGDMARLPHYGMEAFCQDRIVRTVVYKNAQEYHQVLARCRPLSFEDLLAHLSNNILTQEDAVHLIRWWTKFARAEPTLLGRGVILKERLRYLPNSTKNREVIRAKELDSFLYYVDDKKIPKGLPLPTTCLPRNLQQEIGHRTLTDSAVAGWFLDLPLDVWADFISQHRCMAGGLPEDESVRMQVLTTLCKEHYRLSSGEKAQFGKFLHQLFHNKRCLPFDSSEPTQFAAECPPDLYLNTAELKAFDGVGSFNKVAMSLKDAGVTDDFLLALGVRKSVAVDFLFTNLDTLRWSSDPKPLIEYLRNASLTSSDVAKLRSTQYLPCENDVSRTFAPRELFFPSSELRLFPWVKLLQWPSEDELTERSANGKFLIKLGCNTHPSLITLLRYVSEKVDDDQMRIQCLDYIVKHLGPGGVYEKQYLGMQRSTKETLRFLPCLYRHGMVQGSQKKELHSPLSCYSNPNCGVMGFPILDPALNKRSGNLYGTRFRLQEEPDAALLIRQLQFLVESAKSVLSQKGGDKQVDFIMASFDAVFLYLSSRSNEFQANINTLKNEEFIPYKEGKRILWLAPHDVYFKSSDSSDQLIAELFHVIDFSPFLSAAGVRSEPNNQDLFRIMLASPDRVLKSLGEEKYRKLLRRIAAQPPFRKVTPAIKNTPFLLAYKLQESEDGEGEKRSYLLAKASDIYIIDNSFFGRMFPVIRAPHESDLENFYHNLGSSYISKKVVKSFEVMGGQRAGTELTERLSERIHERRPLLVSPSVTSRPLVKDAGSIIDEDRLKVVQADNIKAVYSLGKSVRNQRTTCCPKSLGRNKNAMFVTNNFDWFDVGYAIGGLILQRCQLEDAFFIGSLLEAPVEQLRARGFPVDRILAPPVPEPVPEPVVAPAAPPKPTVAAIPPPSNGAGPSSASEATSSPPPDKKPPGDDGVDAILKQMFPDCEEDYIRDRLGESPSMDEVRSLAEEMATGMYPKKEMESDEPKYEPPVSKAKKKQPKSPTKSPKGFDESKRKFSKRLGKALSGLRGAGGSVGNMMPPIGSTGGLTPPVQQPGIAGPSRDPRGDGQPVLPESDSVSHTNMESMLKNAVDTSAKVNPRGVCSVDTVMTALPEGLSRPDCGCELLPGHKLKPFPGQYRSGKTHNGIRVFSSKQYPQSEAFLQENFHAVDTFGDVLQNLCSVYDLNLGSIAIFHDPTGGTIAFNAGKALHFNVRFFYALHYSENRNPHSRDAYSYWYTTIAHELAHHLVSAHNKEHGFYTESYVTLYLPKLVAFLASLEAARR